MNDIEQKRKRIETIVKVIGLCIAGLLFAPIALMTIKGLVSLIVVGVIALFTVNVIVPWLAVSLANWRLKALKAAASANPIETLENQYKDRQDALIKIRDNIKDFYAVVQELWNEIQAHNEQYPGKPSQFMDKYNKMVALLELRKKKYQLAQQNLKNFGELIEEKRSDWRIAQAAAKASKLANVGEDFTTKLMQDTALTTIQTGLDTAFSELEVSLLDEQPAASTVQALPASQPVAAIADKKSGPPCLDLDFTNPDTADAEVVEPEPVPAKRTAPSARSNRRYYEN